jgi:hypothetical protein
MEPMEYGKVMKKNNRVPAQFLYHNLDKLTNKLGLKNPAFDFNCWLNSIIPYPWDEW